MIHSQFLYMILQHTVNQSGNPT